jgi:hypothetical protein
MYLPISYRKIRLIIVSTKRILFIGHRYHLNREMKGVYDAFGRRYFVKTVFVEDNWPNSIAEIPDYKSFNLCIWFVRFRELLPRNPFDWQDFTGLRVMYDWDVHANYHTMLEPKWIGKWPNVFHKNKFQLLITTSKKCSEFLLEEKINAYWLAKAFDCELFCDKGYKRNSICYFGNKYLSRRAMLDYLKREKIRIHEFNCKHSELNENLNKYTGCLVCNMGGIVGTGLKRLIHHFIPSKGIKLEPGFEPMMKIFEIAAAGCAPIADHIEELSDLGFVDGETMVSYNDFDELVEKLRYYEKNIDKLSEIGKQAGKMSQERHAWDHRVEQLDNYLSSKTISK